MPSPSHRARRWKRGSRQVVMTRDHSCRRPGAGGYLRGRWPGRRRLSTLMDVTVPGSAKRLELPAELQDLALELALALHARGMYPSSHPLLQAALERLRTRIDRALAERGEISLGIAHHQVVIEGVATDDGHPLLR